MQSERRGLATRAIHAGEPTPRVEGAITPPIFQTAMYEFRDAERDALRYIRYSNSPNHEALAAKLAALEGAETGLVFASGMAAIATSLIAVLGEGGHALCQPTLYGGTLGLITEELPALGQSFTTLDMDAPESWEHALRDETRAIYVEAITNPTMRVVDLEAVADFAHRQGLVAMIDATFATPLNLRPVELGFDLVLHSATKYLNGHSDLVAGAIAGRAELVERIGTHLRRLGGTLDPHGCFLLHRGLKTLAPRVAWQNASALALARFLADHDAVARVSYPGLSGHPDHQRARRLFDGFGGMLAFELADSAPGAADRFLDGLELCVVAPSLGGVETLVTVPARSSHASLAPEERRALGVGDALIRVSVGVEDVEDLEADIARALDAA